MKTGPKKAIDSQDKVVLSLLWQAGGPMEREALLGAYIRTYEELDEYPFPPHLLNNVLWRLIDRGLVRETDEDMIDLADRRAYAPVFLADETLEQDRVELSTRRSLAHVDQSIITLLGGLRKLAKALEDTQVGTYDRETHIVVFGQLREMKECLDMLYRLRRKVLNDLIDAYERDLRERYDASEPD